MSSGVVQIEKARVKWRIGEVATWTAGGEKNQLRREKREMNKAPSAIWHLSRLKDWWAVGESEAKVIVVERRMLI